MVEKQEEFLNVKLQRNNQRSFKLKSKILLESTGLKAIPNKIILIVPEGS